MNPQLRDEPTCRAATERIEPVALRPTRVRHGVVAAATIASLLLYLDRYCISFAERYIKADLGLSDNQMGWILSAFFWTYALGQVPSGWLADRLGERRMLSLYILGWSLFTALTGLAMGFWLLVAIRLGFGLAQAGAYPASAGLLSKWVPTTGRGLASGFVAVGGRVGAAAAPLATAYVIALFGWRPAMWLYGIAGLAVAWLFWSFFRDRPCEHRRCNSGEIALIENGRVAALKQAPGRFPFGQLVTSPNIWLLCIAQVGTNIGWLFLVTWLPRYLDEVHRVPVVGRGWMVAAPMVAGWLGMLVGGWLTDALTTRLGLRLGRALPLSLSRFVAMAAYLACLLPVARWAPPELVPWVFTAAFCVVAMSTDLGIGAVWAFNQDVGGRYVGAVLGWGNMWGNLGAAVTPPLLNWLIGPDGRWDLAFLASAAAFFVSGVAALAVDATRPVSPPQPQAE